MNAIAIFVLFRSCLNDSPLPFLSSAPFESAKRKGHVIHGFAYDPLFISIKQPHSLLALLPLMWAPLTKKTGNCISVPLRVKYSNAMHLFGFGPQSPSGLTGTRHALP